MAAHVQIAGRNVGPISYGMMNLTWVPNPPPDSTSFSTMDTALATGATFFNGGEMYGPAEANSAVLLARYLKQHPEKKDKIVLSIKGCVNFENYPPKPDSSPEFVRKSVENTLKQLDGTITCIDVFEPARIDKSVPIETTMETFKELIDEGKIKSIALSECGVETINRAAKVAPIECVEVELSLFTPDVLYNGIAAACAEHNIKLVAFSCLGHGALAGKLPKSNAEIPEGDHNKHLPRFQDDALDQNRKLVDEVKKLADRKGVTPAQIAIAWLLTLSGQRLELPPRNKNEKSMTVQMPTIIPLPGASSPGRAKENSTVIGLLSDDEMKEIWDILEKNPVKGNRWRDAVAGLSEY